MKFIDLDRQYQAYKAEIDRSIHDVLNSGQFILGENVSQLEGELSEFVGAKYGIGVSSGTDALILALMALDIGPGQEVITTPFTFFATAEVVSLVGARPVFVDIDPVNFNIDPLALETVLEERVRAGATVKAVLPVSLFGQCPDMDMICAISRRYDIPVIEDGCQSFGATYKDRRSCGLSEIGVTSFFPSKPLGGYGDGGMIFTHSQELAGRIKMLRNHGQKDRYVHAYIGLNARLDEIQAAVIHVKFRHFMEELKARKDAAERYDALIKELTPWIKPPTIAAHGSSVYAQYTIRIPGGKRDFVVNHLAQRGIPVAVHYPLPLHFQPALKYLGYVAGDFPQAEQAADEVLSLPMHPFITLQEQEQIIKALKDALEQGT